MDRQYFVYIMTSKHNNVLYTGITNDLKRRVYEHKEKLVGGFTKKYNITKLIYYEVFDDPENAIDGAAGTAATDTLTSTADANESVEWTIINPSGKVHTVIANVNSSHCPDIETGFIFPVFGQGDGKRNDKYGWS